MRDWHDDIASIAAKMKQQREVHERPTTDSKNCVASQGTPKSIEAEAPAKSSIVHETGKEAMTIGDMLNNSQKQIQPPWKKATPPFDFKASPYFLIEESKHATPTEEEPSELQTVTLPVGTQQEKPYESPCDDKRICIGIDFGTTFTKSAFSLASGNEPFIHTLRFSDGTDDSAYFKESILYFYRDDNKSFISYEKPAFPSIPIRYFKYGLIHRDLDYGLGVKDDAELGSGISKICSIFYLSHVIHETKKRILAFLATYGITIDNPEWNINMGVPFENYHQSQSTHHVYDTVLKAAVELENSITENASMNLKTLSDYISLCTQEDMPAVHTVPELYAEMLLFQKDKRQDKHFYSVVDVGGGTVDIALFYKSRENSFFDYPLVYCEGQKVLFLGLDNLAAKIKSDSADPLVLKNRLFAGHYTSDLIDKPRYQRILDSFTTEFGSLFLQSNRKSLMRNSTIPYFLMGGGKRVTFYKSAIINAFSSMGSAGIKGKEDSLNAYIQANDFLDVKNDRLIVAQMLATPYELIPHIRGFFWEEKRESETDSKDRTVERFSPPQTFSSGRKPETGFKNKTTAGSSTRKTFSVNKKIKKKLTRWIPGYDDHDDRLREIRIARYGGDEPG